MSVTVDLIVLVVLLLGALSGFKKGLVKSVVSFIGLILAIVIAWYLKNPISEYMYTNLPFFNFTGNMSLYNIVIYELVAFLIILIILLIVVRLIAFATGLIDKLVGLISGLGIVSKILGAVVGFLESYVVVFMVLFLLFNFTTLNIAVGENAMSTKMLESTPILSSMVKDEFKSLEEVSKLTDNYKEGTNEYNRELFRILLKYNVIKDETAQSLIDSNKIKFDGAQDVLNESKGN